MIKLYEIEQKFIDRKINNINEVVKKEIIKNPTLQALPKKSKVAITAGSRGISNIVVILKQIVTTLKEMDLVPFLVPAMGSHGGATAEGQLEVLEHLGITEETVNAPIRSSMDVKKIGTTNSGLPVYIDKIANEADGIIVVNRVKAHTAFQGEVESGLSKMVAVGLGKRKGASFIHSQGAPKMARNILEVSRYSIENTPICMGLAIIENGYDQTAVIKGVSIENWHEKESELLLLSKSMMPSLPIENIDLLIVEEMGKAFSGTGMDPGIIGRWRIEGVQEPSSPKVKRLVVLDLNEKSFGNAQGIGLADFTTETLINKVDRKATYMNSITSTFLQRGMFPLFYASEKETIETAIFSLGPDVDPKQLKIVQIPNTLYLKRVFISEATLQELKKSNREYSVIKELELQFDEKNYLKIKIT